MNAAAAQHLEGLLECRGPLVYVWEVTKRRMPVAKGQARAMIAGAEKVECFEDGMIAVRSDGSEIWLKSELEPSEAR